MIRTLIWLVALASIAAPADAQYRFQSWTADSGLPQNIVTGVQQTADGYLWVATLDGVARFDGVRFTIFNKGNTPGIASNRFTTVFEDAGGALWLGTETGYATRYASGRFVTYSSADGLPAGPIRSFTGDDDGNIWLLSGDAIRHWSPDGERFVEVPAPEGRRAYHELLWSKRGGFWSIDRSDLLLFSAGQWQRRALPRPTAVPDAVAEEQDGTLWIAYPGQTPMRVAAATAASPLPVRQTRWRDRHGMEWSFDVGGNVNRSLTLTMAGRTETVAFTRIHEDREGNLWLGTDGRGLHRVRKELVATYSREEGLVDANIYPIYQDRAGAIWIGAWSGGLSRVLDGRITNFTAKDGLLPGGVTALTEDRDGVLWVATFGGVQQLRNGRLSPAIDWLPSNGSRVAVIHQDRAGALWFGTEQGLVRYADGAVSHFTSADGLASDNVRVLVNGADALWIGSYGGLTRLRNGTFTAWTERDGVPGSTIRALYEDDDGVLWIGTYDSGLGRMHDGRFTRYTTRDGLFNDGVFQILEDARRNLWMSSNRGIFRVHKQDLEDVAAGTGRVITSVAYGKDDGMRNVECNGGLWPAGIRARDGRLWFPTQDGAAVIDPDAIANPRDPPPAVIESLVVDEAPTGSSPWSTSVRIQPGWQNLEIHYTALSFDDPEHMRFRYRLAGLDQGWVEAGTRRTAYYSHTPPGRYVFTVTAAHHDGEWNEQGASVVIEILPPFYRTWWFLTAMAAVTVALLYAGYHYRVTQLKRAQSAQQAFSRELIASQERERQRIAAELHDSLGQSLAIIKNRALLSLSTPDNAGRAMDQLREIATASSDVIAEVRDIAHNLRPYQLDRLGLSRAIEGMVTTVAATHPVSFVADVDRIDGLVGPDDEINLFRIIQESVNNIVAHAEATQATVRVKRVARTIEVTIEDNGRGFDRHHAVATDQKRRGFGVIGMTERARLLGATYRIRSTPGSGTTVSLVIDVKGVAS